MTGNQKLFAAGGFSMLAGIALMISLHWFMSGSFAAAAMGGPWTRHMMLAPGQMGWAMALGLVAMAFWLAGIASLVVALLRSLAKAA